MKENRWQHWGTWEDLAMLDSTLRNMWEILLLYLCFLWIPGTVKESNVGSVPDDFATWFRRREITVYHLVHVFLLLEPVFVDFSHHC